MTFAATVRARNSTATLPWQGDLAGEKTNLESLNRSFAFNESE